jgi:polysaccharide export outer membrane protein
MHKYLVFTAAAVLLGAAPLIQPLMGQITQEVGANLPAQPVGPSDLLAITVYGAPELTRTIRVSEEGAIRLPMLRDKIPVRGLMPAELEIRIAEALSSANILIDPIVTVAIAEYHSRPISVAGAVKMPLTFQAIGKTTLLEALTKAQGLTDEAGTEILVTRPAPLNAKGERSSEVGLVTRIPVKQLIDQADSTLNLALEGGEEIRVPQVGRVFVVGNVRRPGSYKVTDDPSGMTVLKALAMAEGLSPFATDAAYIYRRGEGKDGGGTEVPVELRKLMERKSSDVTLLANDILYIPDNRKKRFTQTAIERALGFASATASGALVLGVNR